MLGHHFPTHKITPIQPGANILVIHIYRVDSHPSNPYRECQSGWDRSAYNNKRVQTYHLNPKSSTF